MASQAKASISRHPLFPAVVALWLAVLLGVGSLALPASLLERLVVALRIDLLVHAATPPLGFTARLLFALVLALGGAVAGFALARRLAGVRRESADTETTEFVEPALVEDDEDLARLEAARGAQVDPAPRKRRSLALAEEEQGPAPGQLAIGPGSRPTILDIHDLAAVAPLEAEPGPEPAPEPELPATTPVAEAAPAAPSASLENLGIAELVERFAAALQARRAREDAAAAKARAEALAPPAPAPALQPQPEPLQVQVEVEPAPPARPIPRFGREAAIAPAARSAPAIRPFDRPAALRRVEPAAPLEDEDEAAHRAMLDSLLLPRRAPAQAESPAPEEADEPALAEGGFSSLLAIEPIRQTFVPHEEQPHGDVVEPIVVFPGQEPPAPPPVSESPLATDADKDLREALAALRRLSGNA